MAFNNFLIDYRKETRFISIINVIKTIVASFTAKCQENSLLPLEIIFPFPNRETKEQILTNYEYRTYVQDDESDGEHQDMEEENELEIDDFKKRFENNGWTVDDDKKLLEYYDIFKDDMTTCVSKLSKIMNKYEEAIEERLKQKGLQYKQGNNKQKKTDPDTAFKENKPVDKLRLCKDSIRNFIKVNLLKEVPHQKIIDYLSHIQIVVDNYIDNEDSRPENAEFQM
jgi:hypothetical protein